MSTERAASPPDERGYLSRVEDSVDNTLIGNETMPIDVAITSTYTECLRAEAEPQAAAAFETLMAAVPGEG